MMNSILRPLGGVETVNNIKRVMLICACAISLSEEGSTQIGTDVSEEPNVNELL